MTYSNGTPAKLVSGRLALDFINTADWSLDGRVIKDRIETASDVEAWSRAVGLSGATWHGSVIELRQLRVSFRQAVLGAEPENLDLPNLAHFKATTPLVDWLRGQSLQDLVALSCLSILVDRRELERVKRCPGVDCGWLFLDETKNSRRKWCLMEVCGNRAKAHRHYAKQQPDRV